MTAAIKPNVLDTYAWKQLSWVVTDVLRLTMNFDHQMSLSKRKLFKLFKAQCPIVMKLWILGLWVMVVPQAYTACKPSHRTYLFPILSLKGLKTTDQLIHPFAKRCSYSRITGIEGQKAAFVLDERMGVEWLVRFRSRFQHSVVLGQSLVRLKLWN